MSAQPEIITTSTFAETAADLILEHAGAALARGDAFRLALSGGNTPAAIYRCLAGRAPDVSRWIITFGDERCFPADHPRSNFRMASEAWLAGTAATVLRMCGELEPAAAALDYEAQLDAHAGGDRFRHDLILLGLGDDGHTASLFPGTAALNDASGRRILANYVPQQGEWRLTFTFPFINEARTVLFLVNDPGKQPIIDQIHAGAGEYPAGRVSPVGGRLIWCLGR